MVVGVTGLLARVKRPKRPVSSCVQEPPLLVVRKMPPAPDTTIVPEVTGSGDASYTSSVIPESIVEKLAAESELRKRVSLVPGIVDCNADTVGRFVEVVLPAI